MQDLKNVQNQDISHDIVEYRTISSKMKVEEDKVMKSITATELKKNLGKYLNEVTEEGIAVTKNGKVIAVLKAPDDIEKKRAWLHSLIGAMLPPDGSIPDDINKSAKEFRHERLEKKYGPFN